MTATNNEDGFLIVSDDNELSYNASTDNRNYGFEMGFNSNGGNRNTLKYNLAKDNDFSGFFLAPGGGTSNDNTLIKNRAIANSTGFGFLIFGDRIKVIANLSKDNGDDDDDHGFDIIGNDAKVLSNIATGNRGAGFQMRSGSGYTVKWNTATKNGLDGIRLLNGAENSTLRGNVALHNGGTDLVDLNVGPPCDNNKWRWNWFRTSDPPRPSCIR